MSNPERLEEFKLKVETFNSVKKKFIGNTSVNNIIRFLKKQDTPLSWLFVHALEAEVNNIEAKRQLLSVNKRASVTFYRYKHFHINAFIKRVIDWNDFHKDNMILYGGARDPKSSMPTVLFNLPKTEQISWHDNTKKEEDISKKENRLAYLRRDTSGANDLEILSLEKELKEAREGYSDDLVDQTIDKLQKDVDQASEQRERQIEVMQAQLDIMEKTGALWDEAHKLLREANEQLKDLNSDEEFAKQFKLTDLAKLLAKSEDISSLSDAGFLNWLDKALTDYRQAGLGKEELEKKYGIDVDKDGKIDTEPEEPMVESSVAERFENRDERNAGIAIGAKLGGYGWSSNATQLQNQLKDKGFDENDINEILMTFRNFNKNDPWKKIWPNLKLSNYSIDKFARGGLADYTGPAWLDGTKTNPELVLNAQDTRNFIALKDILSSLMSTPSASTKTSSGDNYFDINITADIGSDYDVDKLANRIKKQIFEDSQYRNVNTINYLR